MDSPARMPGAPSAPSMRPSLVDPGSNLIWMGALTALMVYEKTGSAGRRVVPLAGVVLLCGAALVLALSPWLPEAVMITN
jgi:hypothetical protein